MKLYATVSSERASKGQGGNYKVEVELTIHPKLRLHVGTLVMRAEKYNDEITFYRIEYFPITANTGQGGKTVLYEKLIGNKRQKDEPIRVTPEQ